MKWGGEERAIAKLERKGRPLPAGYLDKPDLWDEAVLFFDAFFDLSPSRSVGCGEGAIPFEAIDAYADRLGVTDPDEFARFKRLIQAMDGEYRSRSVGKSEGGVSMKDPAAVVALLQKMAEKTDG
ncbi:phage tail assembly chaperone [Hansschlegelia plantiphila]|uniref:phage tail assembly chaperone n=1 Tax=Hansschlegelia plantiphila TaxID=374655 RepID=UPI003D17C397